MKNLLKLMSVGLLALIISAPAALAGHKKVKVIVQKEYAPSEETVYVTEKTAPDLGLVEIAAPTTTETTTTTTSTQQQTTESVYVDGKLVGQTTKIRTMGLAAGNHAIEVRDADGNVVWTEPHVRVMKHETVVLNPE
ncbi:MAG TPA: hypothetical protein VKV95_02900 [Terriglobia bacterium]|nr:hypothetical protein [Terriglobia bacterium]